MSHAPAHDASARDQWEARYADTARVWSGRPNPTLVDLVEPLTPGTALDLGSGEGGDAIWLASRGWRVTGLDLAQTAVDRAIAAAEAAGVSGVRFLQADLTEELPVTEAVDLVTASFFQSMVELPRVDILRRAAELVAPGGHLAVVSHAAAPSWAPEHHAFPFPDPREELDAMALDPAEWDERIVAVREREALAHDGTTGTQLDGVLLLRRR